MSPGVYVESVSSGIRTIHGVPTADTAFVGAFGAGPEGEVVAVASYADFAVTFGKSGGGPLRLFFENGGRRAYVVRVSAADETVPEALDAIPDPGPATLCLPSLATVGGPAYTDGFRTALDWCRRRRCFLLADPPIDATAAGVEQVAEWAARHPSPNAAAYHPRLSPPRAREVVASGAVAGIYARIDGARGVWKAPAGTEAAVKGADAAIRLGDREAEILAEAQVNPLRIFPGRGTLLWGARTLAGNDNEWRYVNVRRLALFVERSVHYGTRWAVFEPNGEPLWATARRSVEDFLQRLFRDGALPAPTADQAYFVKCDRTTMTEADIAAGRLVLLVGFAPVKPAEFVILRIEHQVEPPG